MNTKNTKEELLKEREILQMAMKITARYNVLDTKLALNTAEYLYNANIRLDKFRPKYYYGLFDLDEIVKYALNKIKKEEKIIVLPQQQTHTFLPEESPSICNTNKKALIITYPFSNHHNNYKMK